MKILGHYYWEYNVICSKCDTILAYEEEDIEQLDGKKGVYCPQCHTFLRHTCFTKGEIKKELWPTKNWM